MATLLSAVSVDGAGTGQSHTGPCTVILRGDSVMDKATVQIQISIANTAGHFVPAGRESFFTQPGVINVDAQGTYFLRAVVNQAGASTSLTCETVQ